MKNENEKGYDMNYERAKIFFKKKVPVHLSLKNKFYNGFLLEIYDEFLFINDFKEGKQLVFFIELVKPVEEFMEVEK